MLDRLLQFFRPDSSEQVNFEVSNHLCLNIRSGRRLCQACEVICPVQAIKLTGKEIQISECISCGLCAVACPTGVLDQLWDGFVRVINVSRDRRPYIWLTCHQAGPIKDAVRLNCLGELTPELVFYLLYQGSETINVLYQPELCQECQCHTGQNNWINTLEKLDCIYPPDTSCLQVYCDLPKNSRGEDKSSIDYSRRGMLRSLSGEARQVIGELLIKPSKGHSYHRFSQSLSLRRKLFRYVISHLEPEKVELMEPGYLRHPEIDEKCSFCGSCSTLCASGAMKMEKTEIGLNMTIDPTACNMCGLCAATCPAQAIIVDWTISNDGPAQRMTLAQGERKTCTLCHQSYLAHTSQVQSICPGCRNSQHKPKLIWPEIPE